MNKRILLKQINQKSTMDIIDTYQARIDEDRPDMLKDISQYVECKTGDIITIIITRSK